jgi:hypothetical protein
MSPHFKTFLGILLIVLFAWGVDSFASELPSIQSRVQEQMKEPNSQSINEVSMCQNNIQKYERKVEKYLEKYDSPSWKLRYYEKKLNYWMRYCADVE